MTLTIRRLAAAVFFTGLFAMAVRVSADSDTFWHVRAGAWMIDNRRLLDFDVFSHTRASQPPAMARACDLHQPRRLDNGLRQKGWPASMPCNLSSCPASRAILGVGCPPLKAAA